MREMHISERILASSDSYRSSGCLTALFRLILSRAIGSSVVHIRYVFLLLQGNVRSTEGLGVIAFCTGLTLRGR